MSRSTLFPLRRARLELDRTLRTRSFVGRALQGFLAPPEYVALIGHAADLLGRSEVDQALLVAARHDLCLVEAGLGSGPRGAEEDPPRDPDAGPRVAQLYGRALGRNARRQRLAGQVARALLGTSWTDDARDALERRYAAATRFLALLGGSGRAAVQELAQERPPRAELHALTELTRGAVLGLVTHLEVAWPAPLCHQSLAHPGAVS